MFKPIVRNDMEQNLETRAIWKVTLVFQVEDKQNESSRQRFESTVVECRRLVCSKEKGETDCSTSNGCRCE